MAYFNIFQKKWPETATLEPLEVPVEPRSAAVEHVVAPVEPVLAPVDKGSRGLVFLQALTRYHILIMPAPLYQVHCLPPLCDPMYKIHCFPL